MKKIGKKGGAAFKLKMKKMTLKKKRDYADKQSKAQNPNGLLPSQHTRLVKLVKVNSRRDSS
jgi:hypothetical protein